MKDKKKVSKNIRQVDEDNIELSFGGFIKDIGKTFVNATTNPVLGIVGKDPIYGKEDFNTKFFSGYNNIMDKTQDVMGKATVSVAGTATGLPLSQMQSQVETQVKANDQDKANHQMMMEQLRSKLNPQPQDARLLRDGGYPAGGDVNIMEMLSSRVYGKNKYDTGGTYPRGFFDKNLHNDINNTPEGTTVFKGYKHEDGGIPLGNTGIEVEKDEVSVNTNDGKKFVLSDNATLTPELAQKHQIEDKYIGKTIADIYKRELHKTDLRKADPFTMEYQEQIKNKLINANKDIIYSKNMENFTKDPTMMENFMGQVKAAFGIEYDPNEIKFRPPQQGEIDLNEVIPNGYDYIPESSQNMRDIFTNISNRNNTVNPIQSIPGMVDATQSTNPLYITNAGVRENAVGNVNPLQSISGNIPSTGNSNSLLQNRVNQVLGNKGNISSVRNNGIQEVSNSNPTGQFLAENMGNLFDVGRGLIGSIFPEKENLGRIQAQQVNLDKIDPTQAIKQVGTTYRGASEDLKNSGVTLAQYLNNRLGIANAQAEAESNIYGQANQQNVGISNQQASLNATERARTNQINQGIYATEQDLNDRNKAQAMNILQQGLDKTSQSIAVNDLTNMKYKMQDDLIKSGWFGTKDYTPYTSTTLGKTIPMFRGSDGILRSVPLSNGKVLVVRNGKETLE
jgi:hypothetical protein